MNKHNYTKEDMLKARKIADTYAKSLGKETIEDVINPIREGLNSSDETQVVLSSELARGTIAQLTKLILRQELFTTPDAPYMEWVKVFNDGVVKEGNAKLYDFNKITSHDTYNKNQFVADSLSVPDVDQFTIAMFGENHALTNQAYQFRKPLVYIAKDYIPYFKSGNLTGFIAMLQNAMYKSWNMFLFDRIVRKITGQTYKKNINDTTSANAFECWINIMKHIRRMTTLSSDYNVNSANTNLMSTAPSDIIILAHPDTIQTLQNGIKTQLFQAQMFDFKGIINEDTFKDCGKQLTIASNNSDTVITASNDFYIPENTIYVISKQAYKYFHQVDEIGTQYYPRNLALEIVLHKWLAGDFLPWGQGFKYTSNNLNVQP